MGKRLRLLAMLSAGPLGVLWASRGKVAEDQKATVRTRAGLRGEGTSFQVTTWNLGYLSGQKNNRPLLLSEEEVRAAGRLAAKEVKALGSDFLLLQEVDLHAWRTSKIDQVDLLMRASEATHAAVAVNWDKRYVPYPYWPPRVHFGELCSAQAILCRRPVLSHRRMVLPKRRDVGPLYRAFYLERIAQVLEVKVEARVVRLINVHLEAFDAETRRLQLEEVVALVQEWRGPLVLAGDFNTVPSWARQRSGFSDEPEADFQEDLFGALLEKTGLEEVGERWSGEQWTFPSWAPSRRLDHIFFTPDTLQVEGWQISESVASISDHLHLSVRFSLK